MPANHRARPEARPGPNIARAAATRAIPQPEKADPKGEIGVRRVSKGEDLSLFEHQAMSSAPGSRKRCLQGLVTGYVAHEAKSTVSAITSNTTLNVAGGSTGFDQNS